MPKARIFFVMQYCRHPKTGETLITEEKIQEALDHKTIKRWAYVLHDKDYWNDDDEMDNPEHISGDDKPPHYHVAIEMPKNSTEVDVVAKWFGIPSNFVEIKRGRGAFLDCVEYLTHERENQQEMGKHRYDDSEIKSNFDWRTEINERMLSRAKYGTETTLKERLRLKVLNGEMTLREVKNEYKLNYIADREVLQKLRIEYISDCQPPMIRHNFYVCGQGGIGKGVASLCLAHALYPGMADEDLIFRVGSYQTSFMGYDGQPVIIWDDFRAEDLLKCLHTRGNLFNVFDTTPKKARQNVKYGSINLINAVNIVNSIQPWEDFLNGLVAEYKDKEGVIHQAENNEKNQPYRRFPFILPLRTEDFDILINKGYANGTGDYDKYIEIRNIIGNFGKVAKALKTPDRIISIGNQMVEPLVKQVHDIEEKKTIVDKEEEEIRNMFKNYGKRKEDIEKGD